MAAPKLSCLFSAFISSECSPILSPLWPTPPLSDPQGTYIFAMAPHGITALSAWIGFATEATGFSDLFPGKPHLQATLLLMQPPVINCSCLIVMPHMFTLV